MTKDWKSTVAAVLSGVIGSLTGVMTYQVPAALMTPQAAHLWLWITVACNLMAIVGRVWVGVLTNNADAAAVAGAINNAAQAGPAAAPVTPATIATTPKSVALIALIAVLLCVAVPCVAQSSPVQNLYAAGVSYNGSAQASVAGTALYAHLLPISPDAYSGTYAFTAVDAVPASYKPFTVTSNVGVGVAQKVLTIGKVDFFVPTAVGISWTGPNTGWQWSGGALAAIPLKDGMYLMPTVRFLKSSISGGSGYQPIVGVLFGWGK